MKAYLLFAGESYYPSGGIHDYLGSFDSEDKALATAELCDYDWWHIVSRESQKILKEWWEGRAEGEGYKPYG